MRTAIPLVRRLDPKETGAIELEFDVPAQAADDTPPLFIGIRMTGNDPTAVSDVADGLRRTDVPAEVHLYRLQDSGPVAVTLESGRCVGRGEEEPFTLAGDGLVPGLIAIDADFSSMKAAGLLAAGAVYQELAFAYVPNLPAGRYRASIRLVQNREALLAAKAELLIAYTAKGK